MSCEHNKCFSHLLYLDFCYLERHLQQNKQTQTSKSDTLKICRYHLKIFFLFSAVPERGDAEGAGGGDGGGAGRLQAHC